MSKITIKRSFGQTPNILLNHKEITFKAKGLYGYIQSKSDNWDFSVERIASQSKESVDAVRTGLIELEAFGYLKRVKKHNERGFFETEYILLEEPDLSCETPSLDFPTLDNGIDNSKKEFSNKESKKKEIPVDSNESTFQKPLFSSDQYQDTGLKQENQRKQAKKAVAKSEVDPAYPYFVQKWTESYPELGFNALSGQKIKSLISQAKAICRENGKAMTPDLLLGQFEYVLAYIKRENHFCHGKSISVLDSKYREIYFEIKHGKQKKQPVDSRRSAIDFINSL